MVSNMNSIPMVPPAVFPSDWQHPSWQDALYGEQKNNAEALEFLSRYFDATEIRATQWEFLRPETAALWARRVRGNPRFRFNALLHRMFTHERRLDMLDVHRFCESLRPLRDAGCLGCVVMQFPWVFKFTEENKRAFLMLRRAFGQFPLVAEFRHASWQLPEAQGVLIDYKVGYVNVDLPEHIRGAAPSAELTSPIAYFRLQGRNQEIWRREWEHREPRFETLEHFYTKPQLEDWEHRIRRVSPYADACYVCFANDADAASAANALEMGAMLGDRKMEAPEALIASHGYVLDGFAVKRPVQRTLLPMTALRRLAASA